MNAVKKREANSIRTRVENLNVERKEAKHADFYRKLCYFQMKYTRFHMLYSEARNRVLQVSPRDLQLEILLATCPRFLLKTE